MLPPTTESEMPCNPTSNPALVDAEIKMALRAGATLESLRSEYRFCAETLVTKHGWTVEKVTRRTSAWRDRSYDGAHDGSEIQVACTWTLAIGMVLATVE